MEIPQSHGHGRVVSRSWWRIPCPWWSREVEWGITLHTPGILGSNISRFILKNHCANINVKSLKFRAFSSHLSTREIWVQMVAVPL